MFRKFWILVMAIATLAACNSVDEKPGQIKPRTISFGPGCYFKGFINAQSNIYNYVTILYSFDPDKSNYAYGYAKYEVSWGDGTLDTYFDDVGNSSSGWNSIRHVFNNYTNSNFNYQITLKKYYKNFSGDSFPSSPQKIDSCPITSYGDGIRVLSVNSSPFSSVKQGETIFLQGFSNVGAIATDEYLARGSAYYSVDGVILGSPSVSNSSYSTTDQIFYFTYSPLQYVVPFGKTQITITFTKTSGNSTKSTSQVVAIYNPLRQLIDLHHATGNSTMGLYTFNSNNNYSTYTSAYPVTGTASDPQPYNSERHKFFFADTDGDGKLDMIDLHHLTGNPVMGLYIFTGASNYGTKTSFYPTTGTASDPASNTNHKYFMVDMDNDGKADLVDLHHATGNATMGLYVFLAKNAYQKTSATQYFPQIGTASQPQPYNSERHKFFFADTDGDGKLDLVDLNHLTGNATMGLYIFSGASNYGTLTSFYPTTGTASDPGSNTNHKYFMVDMDNDGKADLVDLHHATGNANMGLYVFLAKNAYQKTSTTQYFPPTGTASQPQPYNSERHKFFFADMDNDGKLDLVDLHHLTGNAVMGMYIFMAASNFGTMTSNFPTTGTASDPGSNTNHKYFLTYGFPTKVAMPGQDYK
jgi:hypothetical protein